jgi:hypothetical protein
MAKENCGGSIAKEYDGFFLRNDSEIRKGADMEPNEAYSLFQENPYHRVQVFAGSLEWAIQRSDEVVKELS